MRITVEIDEKLLAEAMKLTGAKTKSAVVRLAMEELVNQKRREKLISMFGRFPLDLSLAELERLRREC